MIIDEYPASPAPIPARIELPIVVCDVETTGLDDRSHRVIEVSYARIDEGRWDDFKIDTFRFELSPRDYAMGEPRAYAVNGYRRGHPDWKGAPLLDSEDATHGWSKIRRDLTDVILVNQNVSFDAKFLMAEMNRHAKYAFDEAPWGHRTWEVGAYTKLHMKAAKQRGWALHKAYGLIGGPALPEHRAEADVLRAIWVMATGMELFPNVWTDFRIDTQAAKGAVERWAKSRLSA